MHPLPTRRVYELLSDNSFLGGLAIRLSNLPFNRMILLSAMLGPLKQAVEMRLTTGMDVGGKSVYLFRMNLRERPSSPGAIGRVRATRIAEL